MVASTVTLPVLLAIYCGALTEVAGQGNIFGMIRQSFPTPPSFLNGNPISSFLNSDQDLVPAQLNPVQNMVQPAIQSAEEIARKYGPELGDIARDIPSNIQDKNIRDAADAFTTFEEIRNLPNLRIDDKDQETIADALGALDSAPVPEVPQDLGIDTSIVDVGPSAVSLHNKVLNGFINGDWLPVFLELQSLIQSLGALALPFFLNTLLPLAAMTVLPPPLGFIWATLITACASSVSESLGSSLESFSKLVIPSTD